MLCDIGGWLLHIAIPVDTYSTLPVVDAHSFLIPSRVGSQQLTTGVNDVLEKQYKFLHLYFLGQSLLAMHVTRRRRRFLLRRARRQGMLEAIR